MRRVLALFGLIAFGLLLGFIARLIWPRAASGAYVVPARDPIL